MQILKPWLIVCVAICALSVRGADNDRQTKAREALQKLQGSTPQPAQAQQAAPQTPAPPPAQPAPPPPAQPAPPPPTAQPTSQFQTTTTAPANDEAIAKAREAERQKMQEVTTPQPPPPPPAAPPPPVVPPPAVVPTSTVQPPVEPALPMAEEADPAAIAKAREALRLKMLELQAQPPGPQTGTPAPVLTQTPPPPPPPPAPPPPIPAALTTATAATPPPPLANPTEETGADAANIEKAREAMRLKMQTTPASSTEMAGTSSYLRTPERVTGPGNFPPLTAPPSPISTSKQQQLDGLLLKYKADQVTPEQYQAERAKILAGQ